MTTNRNLRPTSVHVAPSTSIDARPGEFEVHAVWAHDGIDRPNTGGWIVNSKRMADRLVAAIEAGVVFGTPEICTDVNGQTYVHAPRNVMGKYMNADLRRLGY